MFTFKFNQLEIFQCKSFQKKNCTFYYCGKKIKLFFKPLDLSMCFDFCLAASLTTKIKKKKLPKNPETRNIFKAISNYR